LLYAIINWCYILYLHSRDSGWTPRPCNLWRCCCCSAVCTVSVLIWRRYVAASL